MRRNTAWAFAGNSVYAGCQWLVFVLLVRRLEVDEVGAFAYAMAITAPVFVLASVRLRNLLATSVDARQEFMGYLTARLMTTAAAITISIGIGVLLAPHPGLLVVLTLMACGRGCDAISDICHGLFQRELDMRRAAVGLAINGIASVTLVGVAVATSASVATATAASALGSLIALACWDLAGALRRARADRKGRAAESGVAPIDLPRTIRAASRLLRTASPLGVSSAIGSVENNLPRYVIASTLGAGPLGVFAALSYLVMLGHLVVNAISQAALPLLAIDLQTSQRRFAARLTALVTAGLLCGVPMLAAAALFGKSVIVWIYGDAYVPYVPVLLWLLAGAVAGFISVFLGAGTTARHRFAAQSAISATSLAVVAVTIVPLLARYGLDGAAMSLFIAAIVELVAYVGLTAWDLRVVAPAPSVGDLLDRRSVAMSPAPRPLRVLNVLGRLERGGAELRAVELAESFGPDRVRSDFVVLSGLDGALDGRVTGAGGRVIKCRLDVRFPVAFLRLLRTERYDVVHSHVHFFSGVILAFAGLAGVRRRVAHLHTARVNDGRDTVRRRAQLAFCRLLLRLNATAIIAAGEGAMESAWGHDWSADARCRIVYNTVRSDRLPAPLPPRSHQPTLINVATVKPLKNQLRLVGVMRHLVATRPNARLLLVGKEEPEYGAAVRHAAATGGINRHVQLIGEVDEPMSWLASADLMVLPSMWEGLPCAVLEAAAVGTPVLASDLPGTREIARHFSHVHLIAADADDETWAAAAARLIDHGAPDAREAAALLARSPFVFERSCEAHYQIWSGWRATA